MIEVKTPSLYELTADLQGLYEFGFEEEEEQAFLDTLEGMKGTIATKADGYCSIIDRYKASVNMIKAEEERLSARRKAIENRVKAMKEALGAVLEVMEQNGEEKPVIKTDLHTIKFHNNGGKQPIEVIKEKVPDNFKRVVLEIDNDKIREALEKGEKLDFAELKPRGRYVEIR